MLLKKENILQANSFIFKKYLQFCVKSRQLANLFTGYGNTKLVIFKDKVNDFWKLIKSFGCSRPYSCKEGDIELRINH